MYLIGEAAAQIHEREAQRGRFFLTINIAYNRNRPIYKGKRSVNLKYRMQIEFGLPTGAGGMAAAHSSSELGKQLTKWSDRYNIKVKTTVNKHDYRHWLVVTFDTEQDLTLFALSFNYKSFMQWQRV